MKKLKVRFCGFLLLIIVASCSKEVPIEPRQEVPEKIEGQFKATNSNGVIMQGFYWDVPMGGTWWGTVESKVASWSAAGITGIWLPPVSKGASGPYSMGYDPCDYFDFGDYDQMGTVETRFGNRAELQSLINTAHGAGLSVYADIVLNHNGGGASEYNPNTGGNTNTAFNPASGIFGRSYNDFHPSSFANSDADVWSDYPDVCHANPWVQDGLWRSETSVAKYYQRELGIDGWRFDWVNGFSPLYINDFVSSAPGFAVTEYWGSVSEIQSCINETGVSSFDFPTMYAMKEAFNNNNLYALRDWEMLVRSNPSKAVTFVTNHDINEINSNKKMLAYAFILANEGTPCVFYSDYETELDKNKLNTLIWINKNLAAGSTTNLYVDNDEYVARMEGSPGLIIYINNSGSNQSRQVRTNWTNTKVHDFSNNWGTDYSTNGSGDVTIWAPANSFTIWSADGKADGVDGVTNLSGEYYIQNRVSGLNIDVDAWGTHDGANLLQWTPTAGNNQKFEFIHQGDGIYIIKSVHSGKVMDIAGISVDNGANVHQWTDFGTLNQRFKVVTTGDGYYQLIATHSNKVVEVGGASTVAGANINQYDNNGQQNSHWKLNKVDATVTPPTNTDAVITLRMLKDVTYGYSLFFTGNNNALSNWGSGVEGSWNEGNYWATTITVPAGSPVEWKVRKGTTGGSGDTWESGSNHIIENPVNGSTYTVDFNSGF